MPCDSRHSGIGSAHGVFGFKAFSHQRALLAAGRLTLVSLFYPPYRRWKTGLAGKLVQMLG